MKLSIGESRPKKWKPVAALIKLVEGVDYTHSFVSFQDEDIDVRKVAEARGGGGRMVTNHQFKEDNHIVRIYHYEINKQQVYKIESFLWSNMVDYGYKHLIGLLIMRAENAYYRAFGIKKRATNRYKDGRFSLICAELSAITIEMATGEDLPGHVEDYGLIEMRQINELMVEKGLATMVEQAKINKINSRK